MSFKFLCIRVGENPPSKPSRPLNAPEEEGQNGYQPLPSDDPEGADVDSPPHPEDATDESQMYKPLAPLTSQDVEPEKEKSWHLTPEHPQDMLHLQGILDNAQEPQDNAQESQDDVFGEFVSSPPAAEKERNLLMILNGGKSYSRTNSRSASITSSAADDEERVKDRAGQYQDQPWQTAGSTKRKNSVSPQGKGQKLRVSRIPPGGSRPGQDAHIK